MYKSLVDGGASGSCVFNYSDGWWKAGNEFAHDDAAEEWFGLVEYTNLTDTQGQVRPVWKTVTDYQSAIITQPKSAEIYINKVPLVFFFNDTIKRVDVLLENNLIYQKQIINTYLTDTLITINSNVNVFTIGAAFNIAYEGFQKRIFNQLTLSRYNVSSDIADEHITATPGIHIFPNPATAYFTVTPDETITSPYFDYEIFNISGMVVKQGTKTMWNTPVNISQLEPGMYNMCINYNNRSVTVFKKILKFKKGYKG